MTTERRGFQTILLTSLLVSSVSAVSGEVLSVAVHGTVAANELTRGPFEDAQVGDPVTIALAIDTDDDIGVGDFHRYEAIGWTVTIDDVQMTSTIEPTFGFTTFSTFHGFDFTSGGLLQPGGGDEHDYTLPVFGASGPPDFWLPQGSDPSDHRGVFGAELFDFFNDNRVVDLSQTLDIAMETITIGLQVEVAGACPGPATITVSGAIPLGGTILAASLEPGSFVVPAGDCAGVTVDVGLPLLPAAPFFLDTDGTGRASLSGNVPAEGCGALQLQAVDGTNCTKSLVEIVE